MKRHAGCISRYGNEMRSRLKAAIAMSLYGDEAYYRIVLPYDTELKQAIHAVAK